MVRRKDIKGKNRGILLYRKRNLKETHINKQTQLEVADILASQLNEKVKSLNVSDEDKSIVLGTMSRIIQLTASISSQAPPTYECIINIWGDDGNLYQKLVSLPYAPNVNSAYIDFGVFIMNPANIESIIYDVNIHRFAIHKKKNKVRSTEILLAAGFEEV